MRLLPVILFLGLLAASSASAEDLYRVDFEAEDPGPLQLEAKTTFPRTLPSKISGPEGSISVESDTTLGGNRLVVKKEPGSKNNVSLIFDLGKTEIHQELVLSFEFTPLPTPDERGNLMITGRDPQGVVAFNLQINSAGRFFMNWPDSRQEGPAQELHGTLALVLRLHPDTGNFELEVNGSSLMTGQAPSALKIASLEISSTGENARRKFAVDSISIQSTR